MLQAVHVDHLQDDEAWGGVLGVTKGLVQEFAEIVY